MMIGTVFQISCRRLLHNRVELLLTFVMPIAFFSIFAVIFGGGVGSANKRIKVALVDASQSPHSRELIESLHNTASLRFMQSSDDKLLSQQQLSDLVRRGSITVGIIINAPTQKPMIQLLSDASDQVAAQVVSAVIWRVMIDASRNQAATNELRLPRVPAGMRPPAALTQPVGGQSASRFEPSSRDMTIESIDSMIEVIDVMGKGKSNPVISMYAAGIAVMFLLFGATGGGGALLEERESETLDRLLSTNLTMDQLLLGKWFYLSCLGILQVTLMFVWGQLVFGVNLSGHLDGFIIMTMVTSGSAAAFGLFLATLCRTRGQLNGLSVILVLSMSALGGSMVPRYLMSDGLQRYGLWTFNAWALDGYDKVFWRELPVNALAPQLLVLVLCGFAFLVAARVLAIRWERN